MTKGVFIKHRTHRRRVFVRCALIGIAALCALLSATATPLLASADKVLQNQRGDVSYQRTGAAPVAIAESASVSIDDGTFAITGGGSLGAVTLPDSSQILLGSNTRVQLAFFNQAGIATARFVLYGGKTRFAIRHPQGAAANYTFSTATGEISVRGTDGDIDDQPNASLRVNVYDLSDPSLPVTVRTKDGRSYTLGAGESLFAHYKNGKLEVDVNKVTQQAAVSQFGNDFGQPPQQGQGNGGGPNGPAKEERKQAASALQISLYAFASIGLGIVVIAISFFGRPIRQLIARIGYKYGRVPMTAYCRRRLIGRPNIQPIYIGRVLLDPQRTRTYRDGRMRRWGFIEETGMWLRVISAPNDVVVNAFYDRGFKLENRVRPRD